MKKNRIVILMLIMVFIFTSITVAVADEGMPDDAYGAINPDYRPSNSTYLILPDELCDCPSIIPPEPHEVEDMEDPSALEIYNIASKEIIIIPSNDTTQQPDRSNPDSIQPYQGLLPPGIVPESIIEPVDDRVQVLDTTTYPWRTICKLYSTFPNGAVGGCSGAIIGCPDGHGYHVLTAGHCVHSQDNGGWATSVKVIPGLDNTYMPLNYAWGTFVRSYTAWTVNEDHQHDWALITLDRNIGDYTGWMGRMTASSSSSIYTDILNTAGYPGDKGGVTMWFDCDSGCSANENNHWYKMDTWSGQSGSPVWRYVDSSRYILTVHAYGNDGSGCNHGTRLNNEKYDRIITWCNSDTPPTDKADLIDEGQAYSAFSPTLVSPGTNFHVWCDVRNVGTASSGGFDVSYYASANTIISTGDYLIGTDYVNSIFPFDWKDSDWTGTFPSGVPDGEYYVGWIIDSGSDVTEFVESNNVGYKDSYKLNVDGTEPSAPVISSSTHPNENTWYCTQNPTFAWTSPSDPSGIYGYSYTLDHSSSTTPNTVRDTTGNSKSYTNLAYGIWYFHVRARDNAGNWGPADHYKIMIEDCNEKDGWYDTGIIEWIDDPNNACSEKEQKEQEYRDYSCSNAACTYIVTGTQWIDTENIRNKPDGTDCGTDFHDEWVSYCKGDEVWMHRMFHDFYCEGGTCTDHTSWADDKFVKDCDNLDGWYDIDDTQWITDPYNACKEKEQKEQEYQDYSCSNGACTYIITSTQWKDTGNVRNKPDGTVCGCSDKNTIMNCSQGECYDTGICNSTYCNADVNCDGKKPGSSCGSGICDDTCQCTSSGMMCGDVDNNDILNIMDVNLLMNHIVDPINYPVDQWSGNVDGIGGIDNPDVILLVMHVFNPNANPLACGPQ